MEIKLNYQAWVDSLDTDFLHGLKVNVSYYQFWADWHNRNCLIHIHIGVGGKENKLQLKDWLSKIKTQRSLCQPVTKLAAVRKSNQTSMVKRWTKYLPFWRFDCPCKNASCCRSKSSSVSAADGRLTFHDIVHRAFAILPLQLFC